MNGYGYDPDAEARERKIGMLVTLGWLVVKAVAIAVFFTIAFGILGVK
jgi:hypothetical protein